MYYVTAHYDVIIVYNIEESVILRTLLTFNYLQFPRSGTVFYDRRATGPKEYMNVNRCTLSY